MNQQKIYINEFYFKNKGFLPELKEKRTILSSNNVIKKIDYDLKLFGIKETNYNTKNIKENFISFKIDEKNEDDLQLLKIGDNYYNNLIDMVKKLLEISKIRKDNNVMDFFIKQKKFQDVFISLMENIKCKCFYQFFWLQYIKNNIELDDEFNFPKIIFEEIINVNH